MIRVFINILTMLFLATIYLLISGFTSQSELNSNLILGLCFLIMIGFFQPLTTYLAYKKNDMINSIFHRRCKIYWVVTVVYVTVLCVLMIIGSVNLFQESLLILIIVPLTIGLFQQVNFYTLRRG